MTRRGVEQGVGAALEVEVEAGLCNVQTGVDEERRGVQGVHSVGTHSSRYERGREKPAPSTVRVTHMRRERLELPYKRVVMVPEANVRARAAVLFGLRQTSKMENNLQGRTRNHSLSASVRRHTL